jgi:hypothetical protein
MTRYIFKTLANDRFITSGTYGTCKDSSANPMETQHVTEEIGLAVTLQTCILEVLGSNLNRGIVTEVYHDFHESY